MGDFSLKPLEGYRAFPGPVVCVILDGIGLGKRDESDGVYLAYTPVLDRLMSGPLYTQLKAHGTAVGMPSDKDMGNSEVGHNTLGAGRIYPQGAKRVHEALASGTLYTGECWATMMERAKAGGTVHFIGLLSDGNVHSHIDHLFAMLDRCREEEVRRVRVHVLLDGRDVGEKSALQYLAPTERKLAELSGDGRDYRIASGGGRMVTTMDRYNADWSIVERGWKAHVLGEGRAFASASEAVQTYYDEDPSVTDQYLDSFVVTEEGKPVGRVEDGDAVLFFNFRGDRALELSKAFEAEDFAHFDRKRRPDVFYAGMMQYDGDTQTPAHYLVAPSRIEGVLGEYLCAMEVTSFAISETQKYGHVTYFWNGNKTDYIDEALETYVEVPSDRVPFDQRPWMKAAEITDATIAAIDGGAHKFIRLNYANGDMVAHTGVPAATRIAVEAVDLALARLLPAIEQAGGVALLLADHGNAELMFTERDGRREPHVAHTLNPVPCIIKDYSGANPFRIKPGGEIPTPGLSHIAATLCNLLGYEAPAEYDLSLVVLEV
ncbi:MAG: 2,3-bisphosphoglycerate-independent phosphoglycerate mutase [Candidatus Hydrogenedentes bacterium]|nr:2,3-bisphosphoglycerate-independent phosphoglycerate mutase [Candidatus Hydrogenedentota bacterium]